MARSLSRRRYRGGLRNDHGLNAPAASHRRDAHAITTVGHCSSTDILGVVHAFSALERTPSETFDWRERGHLKWFPLRDTDRA